MTPRLDAGGVEAVTLETAAAVALAGAGSFVASRGGALAARLTASGAILLPMPVHARDPASILANAARLAAAVRRRGIGLVHVRSRAPAFSALMAGRLAKVPVIATYHGIYGARSDLKRWYNAVMTRGAVTIANSQFTRRHILAQHRVAAERVVVIPEGVDTDNFDPAAVAADRVAQVRAGWGLGPEDRRPIVLQAARLTAWKGQATAIAAFARTAASTDAILVLAGHATSAAFGETLVAAIRAAGLGDRIRIVGATDDMPAAYLAADLVIAPSTAPESFGRSVAEACAMERLTLASPLGAVEETLADGAGWLVAARDVEAWAAAIARGLALTGEARRRIGRRARARIVADFGVRTMVELSFDLYRRVVEDWR